MNYTSIEQGKTLMSLGLPPDSADMEYCDCARVSDPNKVRIPCIINKEETDFDARYDVPCWSVGALMDKMPILIDINRVWLTSHHDGYSCTYGSHKGTFHAETEKTAIDACYKMMVWLLENNHFRP